MMKMRVLQRGNLRAAVVESDTAVLSTPQDALDLLADANHLYGCDILILPKGVVDEAFFDLRSGLAGEMLQKFTNYGMRIALTGDFSGYGSRALRDFIRESNQVGNVLFVATADAAMERFTAAQ